MDRHDLEGVWTVLTTTLPIVGIAVASTGFEVSAGYLLAGVDAAGRRHLLIPLMPGEAAKTDTKGQAVHLFRVTHEGAHYLTVSCQHPELYPVFTQFCRELGETVQGAASPAREASEAFDRWRALFSNATSQVLGDEALVGLLGELLAVEDLLAFGASGRLDFWVGPLKAIHDLRTPSHAIEVKSTLTRDGRLVGISSVDQLQEPPNCDLILRHSRLERDPSGSDLVDVIDRILGRGGHRDAIATRLRPYGISLDDLEAYRPRKFRTVETKFYRVMSLAFPRIVRESFVAGDMPPGILRMNYTIDLTNEPPFPLSAEEALAAQQAFAIEATDAMDS